MSDLKYLETMRAHNDAINAVAADCGAVYYESADGRVKAWEKGKGGGAGSTHSLRIAIVMAESRLAETTGASRVRGGLGRACPWLGPARRRAVEPEPCVRCVRAHGMAVLCLCVAGDLVCTGSADKTIALWRRQLDEGPVKCIQASVCRTSNGCIVYSGWLDKSVRIWWVPKPNGEDTKDHKPCVFMR
ncbi:unnamed protein product [Alopecurus aequalis]